MVEGDDGLVEGDDVTAEVKKDLAEGKGAQYPHLDIPGETLATSLRDNGNPDLLSANAYSAYPSSCFLLYY